jgi:hypothetical protein
MPRYLVKEIGETALNSNKFVKKYKNNLDSEITLQRLENFLEEKSELEHYSSLMVKYWIDGTKLERLDNSGNKFQPEINFKPCYVDKSPNVKELIRKGIQKKPELENNYSALKRFEKSNRVPLPCLIECCDANEVDLWKNLKGESLGGKTSSKKIDIPERTAKLDQLLVWIKNEGHIPLSHPSIEINQIESESSRLDYLADLTADIYGESSLCNFSKTDCWSGENGKRMIISSSAVRQLMVLRHGIPMGKKSRYISWNRKVTKQNYPRILSAMIQTEGSLSETKGQVRFEFKIQDKCIRDICHKCLECLGCSPSKTNGKTFNTGIYNIADMLKLYSFMNKQMDDPKITRKIEKKISESNILISLKKKKWCDGIYLARKRLDEQKPNKKFVELHNQIFHKSKINHANVSSWALGKAPARFSAALIAARILDNGFQKIFTKPLQIYISSTSLDQYVESKP